jgi:hypothetical protein
MLFWISINDLFWASAIIDFIAWFLHSFLSRYLLLRRHSIRLNDRYFIIATHFGDCRSMLLIGSFSLSYRAHLISFRGIYATTFDFHLTAQRYYHFRPASTVVYGLATIYWRLRTVQRSVLPLPLSSSSGESLVFIFDFFDMKFFLRLSAAYDRFPRLWFRV